MEGKKVCGDGRIAFQFLSQLQDVIIYSSGIAMVLVAPNLMKEFISGNDSLRIGCHELQDFEFHRCERNFLTTTGYVHS